MIRIERERLFPVLWENVLQVFSELNWINFSATSIYFLILRRIPASTSHSLRFILDPDWLQTGCDVTHPAAVLTSGWGRPYLTADHAGEVGLLWRVDVELGLVGSLSLVLSADLQSQSVIVAHVDLLPVAE